MKPNKESVGKAPQGAGLRRKAEQLLRKKKKTEPVETPAEKDSRALVHELQVHQIELEMQNEELLLAQAATQDLSDKYANLFDFAPTGYFLWDEKGKILELNLAGAILLGLERSTAIKKRFGQFVAVEDRPIFTDFCKRVMLAKTKQTCEIKLLIDVKPLDVLIEGIAGRYRKGEGVLCRAAVIDITDRKQAATALERMASFPKLNPNPVVEADLEGQVHFVNPAAEQLFPDLKHRGRAHPWLADWDSVVQSIHAGRTRTCTREVFVDKKCYQQAIHYVEEIRRVRIYGLNITERQRAEEAIRDREEELEAIYDNAPLIMMLVDGDRRVRKVNKFAKQFTGAADADLLGRRGGEALRCLHAPDDPRGCGFGPHCQDCTVRRTVLDTFETGRNHHQIEASLPFSIEGKPQDITFLLSTAKLNVRGQPQVLVTIQDVTDRKRAEEDLQKAHDNLELRVQERTAQLRAMAVELTKSEQTERDRLAQVLHDELQQLLFAARMKVSLLRNSVVDEKVGQTIEQLDDLLKQSISESRSLAVELSPPILREKGLTAGLEWLAGQIKEKHGLAVTVDAESEAEPLNEGVRILLYQVVRELLFNVAKHAQTDCAQVKIARTTQGQVHLEVSDNGVGFHPDKMQDHAESGDGFGLSSIRQRLEVLGGRLKMDSSPGKGTRMVIQAPWGELPQPLSQTAAGPVCHGPGRVHPGRSEDISKTAQKDMQFKVNP